MRAISLRQPWANLVAARKKTIETRTWATRYRGPVLIVASKGTVRDVRGRVIEPRGVAVAMARITGCRPMRASDGRKACIAPYPRAQAWILKDIRRVPHVPVRGTLGFYAVRWSARFGSRVRAYFGARTPS